MLHLVMRAARPELKEARSRHKPLPKTPAAPASFSTTKRWVVHINRAESFLFGKSRGSLGRLRLEAPFRGQSVKFLSRIVGSDCASLCVFLR
jgi:hypothetical protein